MRASVKLAGSKVMLRRRRRRHRCSYWRRTITRLLGTGEIFKGNKPGNCQNEINSGIASELYYADEQSGLRGDDRRTGGGRRICEATSVLAVIQFDQIHCAKSRETMTCWNFSLYILFDIIYIVYGFRFSFVS